MNSSLRFFFDEFNRKLDEIEARWEERFPLTTRKLQGAAEGLPMGGGLEQIDTAQQVVADNWGGLFDGGESSDEQLCVVPALVPVPAPDATTSDSACDSTSINSVAIDTACPFPAATAEEEHGLDLTTNVIFTGIAPAGQIRGEGIMEGSFLPDLRGNDFEADPELAIADRFRIPVGEIDGANDPIDPGPEFTSQDSEAKMRALVSLPHLLPSGELLTAAGNWDSCQAAGVHIPTATCNDVAPLPASCSADCFANGYCFLEGTCYDKASAASAAHPLVVAGIVLTYEKELGHHHSIDDDSDVVPADALASIVNLTLAHHGEAPSRHQLQVPKTVLARAASVFDNIINFEQYLDELDRGKADLGEKLLRPMRYCINSSHLMICSVWWGALPVAQSVTFGLSWELTMLERGFFDTSKEVQYSAHCFSSQCYKCRAYICFVYAVPNTISPSLLSEIHGDRDNLNPIFNGCIAPVCVNIISTMMFTSSMHLELRKKWLVADLIRCLLYSSDCTVARSLILQHITTAHSEMTVATNSHQLALVAKSGSTWLEKSLSAKSLTDCIICLWKASADANFVGEDGPLPAHIVAVWSMDGIIQNVNSKPPLQGSDLDVDMNVVFDDNFSMDTDPMPYCNSSVQSILLLSSLHLHAIQMPWDPGGCCTRVVTNSGQGTVELKCQKDHIEYIGSAAPVDWFNMKEKMALFQSSQGITLFLCETSKSKWMRPMLPAPWSRSLFTEMNDGVAQLKPFFTSYTTLVFWTRSLPTTSGDYVWFTISLSSKCSMQGAIHFIAKAMFEPMEDQCGGLRTSRNSRGGECQYYLSYGPKLGRYKWGFGYIRRPGGQSKPSNQLSNIKLVLS